MARVNVEQKALVDVRFKKLGSLAGAPVGLAASTGIGLMCFIWNHCQELETKTLTPEEIALATGIENGALFVTEAGLGIAVKSGRIRIRGTKGRIEWLAEARKAGRAGGKLGGRPKKTPTGPESETHTGSSEKTPPAPAPAPKTKASETKKRSRTRAYSEDSIEYTLAARLFTHIHERNPKVKAPDLQKWANDVRLMIERDGRDPDDIRAMIDWCQSQDKPAPNGFCWATTILSTSNLREHFDRIIMQSSQTPSPKAAGEYVY